MEQRGIKQELEARRFRAIALLRDGIKACEVARMLGVTAGAVSQWNSVHEAEGSEGLRSRQHPGPAPKLSEEQKAQVPEILAAGPTTHGFATELWTLSRVAEVIRRRFDVEYHPAHVWKILTALGWTCQKPERLARERNEELVAHWRAQEWPRIKKGPDAAAGLSSS